MGVPVRMFESRTGDEKNSKSITCTHYSSHAVEEINKANMLTEYCKAKFLMTVTMWEGAVCICCVTQCKLG